MNKSHMFGLLFVSLMLVSMIQVASGDNNGLQYSEENKNVTISYENMTLVVNAGGQVPMFHLELNDGFGFNVIFKQIAEYYDTNNDGAFQYNETTITSEQQGKPDIHHSNILALPSVKWDFSGFNTESDDNGKIIAIHFNFTSESIRDPAYADFNIQIRAHLYLDNQTIDNYTIIGGQELKFDIAMSNWPWIRNDTNLALRFDITPLKNGNKIKNPNGGEINTHDNITGQEHKVENQHMNKAQFEIGNDTEKGFFAYANQARYNDSNQFGSVNASYATLGDGSVQTYLSFEHFDSVEYDPSIGYTTSTITQTNAEDTSDANNTGLTGDMSILLVGIPATIIAAIFVTKRKVSNKQ